MKKQLLAAAIAAAVAVPMTASAGDVTLYGTIHMSIDSYDRDSSAPGAFGGTASHDKPDARDWLAVNSNNSILGVKGTEDLGNGLSALFQMEFWMDADDRGSSNALRNNRNTFVGLAGSWGVVGIGGVDTPYKSSTGSLELFSVVPGDYNGLYFDDIRASDAVFYMSPNWNGFSFQAAVVMPSLANAAGADADGVEATSIALKYSNGPFFAAFAHEAITGEYVNALYTMVTTNDLDYDKWRIGLGYTANGFHVGFVYEDRDLDHVADGDSWQLSGSYTMGNNVLKAAYGEADGMVRNSGMGFMVDDAEMWSIGLDHKLSKRTKVYAQYADFDTDADDTDMDAFSVGIVHKF
ncbi:MAG: porin [Gammaproteobacteria bacterium]|nr:porin [Gammaproteobacteria bacterium]